MAQLPFKTQPRQQTTLIGNEDWGTLEFPIYGDLIVGERLAIDEAENKHSIFRITAEAAVTVAGAEEMSYIEAHAFITKCVLSGAGLDLTAREQELNIKYAELLVAVSEKIITASYEKVAVWATALIQHRLEGMDDWTLQRTLGLPQGLVNSIYTFGQEEAESKSRSQQDKQDEEAKLEEELGKLQTVLGSLQNPRSGGTSTGSASDTGPTHPSSTPTPSSSSRPATSRKPSSKAPKSTRKSTTSTKSGSPN